MRSAGNPLHAYRFTAPCRRRRWLFLSRGGDAASSAICVCSVHDAGGGGGGEGGKEERAEGHRSHATGSDLVGRPPRLEQQGRPGVFHDGPDSRFLGGGRSWFKHGLRTHLLRWGPCKPQSVCVEYFAIHFPRQRVYNTCHLPSREVATQKPTIHQSCPGAGRWDPRSLSLSLLAATA